VNDQAHEILDDVLTSVDEMEVCLMIDMDPYTNWYHFYALD